MFPIKVFYRSIAASLLLAVCLSDTMAAQEVLDEIIVTADFRERAASRMPASITVLSREAIEQAAIQHFEELVSLVPNLNWSGDGHRARYFQIRGVGELEQYEGAPNPSVGFLIDDIDFSGIGTIATLFDIQQIEVLRGPQGSRYGANALAGLVYVRSADPGDKTSGQFRIGAGQDDALTGGIAFGGPLADSDALKYRISAHHYQSDGFRNNSYLNRDDTNGRDETTLRGKLLWETSSDWTLKFAAMFSDINDGYDAFAIDNSLTVLSNRPGRDAQRSLGASLRADWTGSDVYHFTAITSVANSDIDFSFDADWGNENAWAPVTYDFVSLNDRNRQTISQEFRLSSAEGGRIFGESTDWLLGVYLLKLEDELDTLNQGEYFDPGFDFSASLDDRFLSAYEALNAALFGQLEFDVGKAGQVILGLRFENRSTDYNDSGNLVLDPSESMIGGELAYSHLFSDSLTAYAGVSRGYKAGGFNLFAPGDDAVEDLRQFGQEQIWSIETGIKSAFFGESLFLNAALFYNERRNQQVRTSVQLRENDPASFAFITENAPESRTYGIEADVRWLAGEALELYANIGLLNAKFGNYVTSLVDLSDRDQAHAPRYTLAMGGIFRHSSGLFTRLDFTARDDFFFDVSHNQKSSAYQLVNARLGYEADRWTLQLWARNLFDESYAVRGFFFGNEPPLFPPTLYIRQGDPRQIGVTFDMGF